MIIKEMFVRKLLLIMILINLVFITGLNAEKKYLLIKNGKIVDLSGKDKGHRVIEGEMILIKDKLIDAVGEDVAGGIEESNVTVIDAKGKFIVPGLIDGFAAINNQFYANAYLYMGITSIIAVDGGRRGPFFGDGNPSPSLYRIESVGDEKKSTEEHLKDLRELFKKGYRIALLKYQLRPNQVKACVKEAKKLGMGTIGELGYTTYKEGCNSGVDAFVHTTRYSMDIAPREMAKRVADHPFSDDLESAKWKYYKFLSNLKADDPALISHSGVLGSCNTFIMPTMSLSYLDTEDHKNPWNEDVANILNEKDINAPADRITGDHRYRKEVQSAYSNLIKNERVIEKRYYRSGAKYLAGSATDVWGTMPGISLHTELRLLKNIGLTNREVILAATENFSRAFGWKIGKIEKGFNADILILNSDPLKNIDNLKDIFRIIHVGKVIKRENLTEKVRKIDGLVCNSEDYDPSDFPEVKKLIMEKSKKLKKRYEYLNHIVVKKIKYFSDGLRVTAYIAYPQRRGKYPSVIYNRGGNREFGKITPIKIVNILGKVASWGYVVIGSQYRGNDGGEGVEEFGGKDVNDILNLIPVLKNFVYADPGRIGVYGWSRGGMMTYLTLKRTGIFKAAVIGGGLSDLKMMMDDRPDMEKYVYAELIPDYYKRRRTAIFNRSAVKWVAFLPKKTPLLLMHGTADWRVSPEQSLRMAGEMLKYKIPYRLVMFEGGDHGLTEFPDEVDNMAREWFDRYLKKGEKPPVLKPHGK